MSGHSPASLLEFNLFAIRSFRHVFVVVVVVVVIVAAVAVVVVAVGVIDASSNILFRSIDNMQSCA